MPRNPIQFQSGLSLPEFLERYGDEQQCRDALFQIRWPEGFVCPECGNDTYCVISRSKRFQCNRCHHQTSLTVGTVFEQTHQPLRLWFLAIYLITQRKNGLSTLQLSRELGVHYDTAWKMRSKLNQTMKERQQSDTLGGRVEMDDAYLGGEQSGKPGRGAANKVPFVAAVETRDERPLFIQLRCVEGFTKQALREYAENNLTEEAHVLSDGLQAFEGIALAGRSHEPQVTGRGRQAAQHPNFHWVNTMLGNIKNAIRGTYHAVSPKHAPRYLAEFEYRFNRRFNLPSMVQSLARDAVQTPPMPYRFLKMAEERR